MAWARIDDGLDDHPKVLTLLDHEDAGVMAIGLWTLCLTWAHRNTRRAGKIPGLIPLSLPRRYLGHAGRDAAKLLVDVGMWDVTDGGWLIHDFGDYLPSDETRAARSEAGKRGAAKRWESKREADAKEAEANAKQDDGNLPSACHDDAGNDVANDGSRAGAHRDPTPVPEPSNEPSAHHVKPEAPPADAKSDLREDVELLCKHLADRIEANGSVRPTIGEKWRDAARLMIDKDLRPESHIHRAIDWCQDSDFWRPNILSMPKLRLKYDQMRLQAEAERAQPNNVTQLNGRRSTTDDRVAQAQALKHQPPPVHPGAIQGVIVR